MDITTGYNFNLLKSYTPEMIQNLIADPIENNEELRKLSRQLYNSNGIVTNTIDYMTSLPTLDRVIVGDGENKAKNKRNVELAEEALKLMRDKEFIRDALFSGAVDGTVFYYCETTKPVNDNTKFISDYEMDSIAEINSLDMNISIITLPVDYCRIRGLKNSHYVVAFDLRFFNECGEKLENKLKKYPKEIRDGYYRYEKSDTDNPWLILDNTKTIVHKIRSARNEKWGRPIVLAAISDIFYEDYFVQTKRSILSELSNQIIIQTFPEGKDKGTSALTGPQQEKQHIAVKDAVCGRVNRNGVTMVSVAAGTKLDKIEVNDSLFDSKNETNLKNDISASLGFANSLLSGSSGSSFSAQQSNLELVFSQIFSWVESISDGINRFLNMNIIKDPRNPVRVVYLPTSLVNRDKVVGYLKDLYLQGKGSLKLWISATGINPEAYLAVLDAETEQDLENKYPTHKTSHTLTGKDSNLSDADHSNGRPKNDNPTNENTIVSKTNGANDAPSPRE